MRVLIIGCSAGGAGVAARLRRLDESAEIIIVDKSSTISFATCGIPYYLGGIIEDRDRLEVIEKQELSELLNIDIRTESEVIAIDKKSKKVLIRNNQNKKLIEEGYDKLVLATGGVPIRPQIEGINGKNIFTLRTAEDTDTAFEYINNNHIHNALIIGAGFIGLEMAENLHARGMNVNVVDSTEQVMGAWDYEMAVILHQHLRVKGVNLVLDDSLQKITDDGVVLSSGKYLKADVIFLCIGIRPNIKLAKDIGLKIGKAGGILVNPGMVTSDPDIYALGDVVEVTNIISNDHGLIPLAGIAQRQARVVADNIFGLHRSFAGAQGVAIAKVFDLAIAITGLTERQLHAKQINYNKTYIETPSHAGFYPDAMPMIIKLLFAANTGRILGAQIVGAQGVDKRIDVIASAMQFEKTIYDLAELELAYAPPFSSAKDPVNIIGMTAVNMMERDYQVIHWNELDQAVEGGAILLDVREREEFEIHHLDGAINIPLNELRVRYVELPPDKTIVTYCQQGKKGYFATKLLRQYGFTEVLNLSGGQKIYQLVKHEKRMTSIFAEEQVDSNDFIKLDSRINNNASYYIGEDINKDSENGIDYSDAISFDMQANVPQQVTYIDVSGLTGLGSIMRLSKAIRQHKPSDIIKLTATDPEFVYGLRAWVKKTNHVLLSLETKLSVTTAFLRVGNSPVSNEIGGMYDASTHGEQMKLTKNVNSVRNRPSFVDSQHGNGNMMTIDACGLSCPGPIMKLSKLAIHANGGDRITITATDIGFKDDLTKWSDKKGFRIVNFVNGNTKITAILEKI